MPDLLSEFESVDYQTWLDKATRDLKGTNPIEQFKSEIGEGVTRVPYYDRSSMTNGAVSTSSLVENRAFDAWYNTAQIVVGDEMAANQKALTCLKSGCNGVRFVSSMKNMNLQKLLTAVEPSYCYLSFSGFLLNVMVEQIQSLFDSNQISKMHMAFTNSSKSNFDLTYINQIIDSSQKLSAYKDIKTIHFEVSVNDLNDFEQTTCKFLNQMVEILTVADDNLIFELFNKVVITFKASNDFFLNIACLRALRILFAELGKNYGLDGAKLFIESHTSISDDPLKSLLSNTSQAMSVVIGTSDAIIVTPANQSKPGHAERIARNVSLLLAEESHLDKVIDPSAGSYYIEHLTNQIAQTVWDKFLAVENNGGYFKSLNV